MIKPSMKLEKEIRDMANEQYKHAQQEIGEEEFHYIGQSMTRKVKSLRRSGTAWVRELAKACEAIHQIYLDHIEGTVELSDGDLRAIGAALFYFVNPYDIIPDHIPATGYLDDAHVVNACIKIIDRRHPGMIAQYCDKLEDIGS